MNKRTVTVSNIYTVELEERLDDELGRKLYSATRVYPQYEGKSKDILIKNSLLPVKMIDPSILSGLIVIGRNSKTLKKQLFLIEMTPFGTFKRAVNRIDIDPSTRDIYIQPEDMKDKEKDKIIYKIGGTGTFGFESVAKINLKDYIPSVQTISVSLENFEKLPETIGYNMKHILPKPGKISEFKYENTFENFVATHQALNQKIVSR